jgi:NAD(P)-dependent dehydrogenase (short-subunit alcohol dehydrogenase family)
MQVALTGAASGIGAETARLLKEVGHHVTAFDISEPSAHVDHWIKTDMSDPASITAAIAAAEGPFDALINNAGLPPREGQSALVLNVNFIGLRAFLQGMMGQLAPGASIVNTASRAGAFWRDNLDQVKGLLALEGADELDSFIAAQNIDHVRAYNLSKEAVIVMSMAETQATIARGIRMNSVSPAAVSTGILDDFVAAFGEKVAKNIARAGRAGTATEIAEVLVFMASPASHWMKGVDVIIDGGMGAMAQSDMMGLPSVL